MKKQLLFVFLSILLTAFCFGQTQVNLPVTFDDPDVNYALVDFGGNASNIEADPVVPTNMVCKVIKSNTAELWAGTTIGGTAGFANAIPFVPGSTTLTMRVYSPDAGIPVRMKVEDPNDPTKSVETEDVTATANGWETLEFNFANQAGGTAPINYGYTYQKLSVFFNFGTPGAVAGEKTYFCDDIEFGGSTPAMINVTFRVQNPESNPVYVFGSWSNWVNWPGDPMTDAGNGLFTATLSLAPNATYEYLFVNGIDPVKEVLDPAWSCTNGNGEYTNRLSTLGSADTTICYVWNTCNSCNVPVLTQVDLPVTFDDPDVNYALVDFGGNASNIEADPVVPTNMVCKVIKSNTAELWAGTTIGGTAGFATAIPFVPGSTTLTMRVYSPDSGIPVRMKVEDPNDPTKSVETEDVTATANGWETLEFNFANQAGGTAPINYGYTYQKLSVFFNFGTPGAVAGEKTYFCDDIVFGFQTSVNDINKEEIKLSLSKDGIRIFSNRFAEIDQVGVFDVLGRNIYLSGNKSKVNTLIPILLNSGTVYVLKIKVNNQVLTFKGLFLN